MISWICRGFEQKICSGMPDAQFVKPKSSVPGVMGFSQVLQRKPFAF